MNAMPWEAVGIITGAVLTVGAFLGGLLLSHGTKLGTILTELAHLRQRSDENLQDHRTFYAMFHDTEHRITVLEQRDEQ